MSVIFLYFRHGSRSIQWREGYTAKVGILKANIKRAQMFKFPIFNLREDNVILEAQYDDITRLLLDLFL